MDEHDTYQHVLTDEDVGADERDAIADRVTDLYAEDSSVRFTPSDEGPLELEVPEQLPRTDHATVRDILEEELSLTLDRYERFILELHVAWPSPCYRICIGYE